MSNYKANRYGLHEFGNKPLLRIVPMAYPKLWQLVLCNSVSGVFNIGIKSNCYWVSPYMAFLY